MTDIPEDVTEQMEAIVRAVHDNEIAVMQCSHHETGEPVYVLCAVRSHEHDGEVHFDVMPITTLDGRDPYEFAVPPTPFTHLTAETH